MTTPKKKHIIELMIEAGVKWPDGAEYAAQDKNKELWWFEHKKPYMESGKVTWSSDDGYVGNSLKKLDSLCRNWHQTIVPREQYADAVAAANTSGKTNQARESEDVPASQPAAQLYSGVAGVMPSETIESMLDEIKAKREEHDALAAKADALVLEISGIEKQVNDKLKENGFAMSPLAAPSEPERAVITDWRDLRVGDVVECVTQGAFPNERWEWCIGQECVVVKTEDPGRAGQPVKARFNNGDSLWIGEFRFIRRP